MQSWKAQNRTIIYKKEDSSAVDDVSSTIDSITDGSTLKKRNLPTNDTSGSQNIAARVKERRRPVKKKQKQPRPAVTALDSPGSTQHK